MSFASILDIFYLVSITVCSILAVPKHGFLTQYYFSQRPIHVNDSMVIELTNRFPSDTTAAVQYQSCDVNIVTDSTHRLFVHFLALKISPTDKDIDRLHIYDYKANGDPVRISSPQGLYGLHDQYSNGLGGAVKDYMSTGYMLKLDYQGKPTREFNGFKILITSVKDLHGDCGHGYIRCQRKSICVPESTRCDGYNNCGSDDQGDEVNCDHSIDNKWIPFDGSVVAGITVAVSCTVFFLVAGVLVLGIIRANKRDKITTNYSSEFGNKSKNKQWRKTSRSIEQRPRPHAPPSYEVVIGTNTDPPHYQSIAYESETSPNNEQTGTANSKEYVKNQDLSNTAENTNNQTIALTSANVTLAIATCDAEKGAIVLHTPNISNCDGERLALTNNHNCIPEPNK